mmetsp:Transcript_5375/g.14012  ORF Transcript_5375/g.14012 Transcript_5375/m.14012 type:complete len:247 (+) Transcript_5375:2357-3097(+)
MEAREEGREEREEREGREEGREEEMEEREAARSSGRNARRQPPVSAPSSSSSSSATPASPGTPSSSPASAPPPLRALLPPPGSARAAERCLEQGSCWESASRAESPFAPSSPPDAWPLPDSPPPAPSASHAPPLLPAWQCARSEPPRRAHARAVCRMDGPWSGNASAPAPPREFCASSSASASARPSQGSQPRADPAAGQRGELGAPNGALPAQRGSQPVWGRPGSQCWLGGAPRSPRRQLPPSAG